MKHLLLMLSMVIIFGCTSSGEGKPETANHLIGKWQLIEQLQDPGDGSGTFQSIDSNRVIEFFSNGTLEVNGVLCYMSSEVSDKESGTYMLITDYNIDTQNDGKITPNICDSRSVSVYFDLPVGGDLILWYSCIEPCGQKFKKIN